MELRTYQQEAVAAAWDAIKGGEDPLIVAPTGSGKSLMIAALCAINFRQRTERHVYATGRAVVLAHRKELLEQNAGKLAGLLPELEVGLYSSGLRSRDVEAPVIVGGIQSIWNQAEKLGDRDLVLIDEAHLVSPGEGTRYQKFLGDLRILCPRIRIAGFTATPFRTNQGDLVEASGVFSRIAHEIGVGPLIESGYLCNLVSRIPSTVDMSGVAIRQGEYAAGQAEQRWLSGNLLETHATEVVGRTGGRKKVLVFCSGVDHAEQFTGILRRVAGEPVEMITGTTPAADRDRIIRDFRDGSLRWLVNVDVLTVGFDSPNIDAICVLRATCSAGLFAQICGRGFRIAPGKEDCLILDWGGNIRRHGALDHSEYGRIGGRATDLVECKGCKAIASKTRDRCEARLDSGEKCGTLIEPWDCKNPQCNIENVRSAKECNACGTDRYAKVCPRCETINPAGSEACSSCGFMPDKPERDLKLAAEPDKKAVILFATAKDHARKVQITSIGLKRHPGKNGKPDSVKINYEIEELGAGNRLPLPRFITQWICPEHEGYARKKFVEFWRLHAEGDAPGTVAEAIATWQAGGLRMPVRATVLQEGSFWEIRDREFEEDRPKAIAVTDSMLEIANKEKEPWDDLPF